MNNTFNLNRFGLLLKRQWQEFGKIYLTILLVVTGIIIIFYAYNIPEIKELKTQIENPDRIINFRDPLFIILGFLFISAVSSNYFAALGQKPRAIIELMVPGSIVEKFTAAVLFTSVLTTLSFVLIFYITDLCYVNYLNNHFTSPDGEFVPFLTKHSGNYKYIFYVLPFATSSLFLLGSVYFNRFHYIKTAVAVMLFGSLFSYVMYNASRWLYNGKVRVMEDEGANHITENQMICLMVGTIALFAIVLWTISFIRLKEKEV